MTEWIVEYCLCPGFELEQMTEWSVEYCLCPRFEMEQMAETVKQRGHKP